MERDRRHVCFVWPCQRDVSPVLVSALTPERRKSQAGNAVLNLHSYPWVPLTCSTLRGIPIIGRKLVKCRMAWGRLANGLVSRAGGRAPPALIPVSVHFSAFLAMYGSHIGPGGSSKAGESWLVLSRGWRRRRGSPGRTLFVAAAAAAHPLRHPLGASCHHRGLRLPILPPAVHTQPVVSRVQALYVHQRLKSAL